MIWKTRMYLFNNDKTQPKIPKALLRAPLSHKSLDRSAPGANPRFPAPVCIALKVKSADYSADYSADLAKNDVWAWPRGIKLNEQLI